MEHMQEVKDLLTETKLSAIPTCAELKTLTQVVLNRLGEVTFGHTEARERVMELVPAAVVDSLEAMQTRAEYDERLSVPMEALLVFKGGLNCTAVGGQHRLGREVCHCLPLLPLPLHIQHTDESQDQQEVDSGMGGAI